MNVTFFSLAVRLRFLLALAVAALLWAGLTPAPSTPAESALFYVLVALAFVAAVIIVIAIFDAAERSDGRAPNRTRPQGHDYYGAPSAGGYQPRRSRDGLINPPPRRP